MLAIHSSITQSSSWVLMTLGLASFLAAGCDSSEREAAARAEAAVRESGAFRATSPAALPGTGGAASAGLELLMSFEAAAEGTPWTVEAPEEAKTPARMRVVPNWKTEAGEPGTLAVNWIPGFQDEWILRLPIEGKAAGLNEVGIEVVTYSGREFSVEVRPMREGRRFAPIARRRVKEDAGPKALTLPMPSLSTSAAQVDELEIALIFRQRAQVSVAAVHAIRKPATDYLPPEGAPEVRGFEGEYRTCVGLTDETPVAVPIDSCREAELRFAVAPAMRVDPWMKGWAVEVTVERDGKEVLSSASEFAYKRGQSTWGEIRVDLSSLGAGEALATVRLVPMPSSVDASGKAAERSSTFALLEVPTVARKGLSPPTVVLVTSDTHRADHMGLVAGVPPVFTPELDALGRSGVYFTNCYSQTNVTTPSHAALLTGVHPRDTRLVTNRTRLVGAAETLAEAYRDAGYATLAVTSAAHRLDPTSGLGQGFARMEGPRGGARDAQVSVAKALDWMGEMDGLPVFIWLHLFDAHDPYGPPEPYAGKYYPKDKDPRDPANEWPLAPELTPHWIKDVTDVEQPYAEYRAEIDYLDHELGALLNLPRVQDGIVAFTADHGENFGEHGIWWSHGGMYPSTIHVPLVMRWSGGPRGLEVDGPVRQMDVGRTLLNLSGLDGQDYPGRDLRWAIDEPTKKSPRYGLSSQGLLASVEADGWLFTMSLGNASLARSEFVRPVGMAELYHLTDDPKAERDVLMDELTRGKAMRARLLTWLQSGSAEGLVADAETSPEMEKSLAALGYAKSEAPAAKQWWIPEQRDPNWATSEWRLLFEE